MSCNCGKKPQPAGHPSQTGQQPAQTQQPGSLLASAGGRGVYHVAPNGTKTAMPDTLAAQAAAVRKGGHVAFE